MRTWEGNINVQNIYLIRLVIYRHCYYLHYDVEKYEEDGD
jgi:hypothetical protein